MPEKIPVHESIEMTTDTNKTFFWVCGVVVFVLLLLIVLVVLAFSPDKQTFAVLIGIVGGIISFISLLVVGKIQQTSQSEIIRYVDQSTKDIFEYERAR